MERELVVVVVVGWGLSMPWSGCCRDCSRSAGGWGSRRLVIPNNDWQALAAPVHALVGVACCFPVRVTPPSGSG
jgi:hypothetical protein